MFYFKGMLRSGWRARTAMTEKRLHKRALLYWEERRAGRDCALLGDFNIAELEGVDPHSFLLDMTLSSDPIVAHVGDLLREEADLPSGPSRLENVRPASLLGQFARRWETVVEERQPLTSEYVFTTEAGFRVSCRGVLLPLSATGHDIDHLCGVVGWKSEKIGGGVEPSRETAGREN
jgi:hypothetical protein